MAKLTDPITILRGIGPAKAKLFHALNIFTLEDLICHFPRGYEDRTKLVNVCDLEVDKPACFRAMVMNTPRTNHIRQGLDMTKVQVADATGRLHLTFLTPALPVTIWNMAGNTSSTEPSPGTLWAAG